MVEYAFLLVLMLLAFLSAVTALGQLTANTWDTNCQSIKAAIGP